MIPTSIISIGQRCGEDGRTHSREADLVAEIVEATNAILSVLVVVVLDKAEPE